MPRYRTAKEVADYIRRQGKTTMYIKKTIADLSGLNVPNAGPRPNITGMRNLYWGKNAIVALQGDYAYKVSSR